MGVGLALMTGWAPLPVAVVTAVSGASPTLDVSIETASDSSGSNATTIGTFAQKTAADYGVDIAPRITTLKVEEPAKRSAGVKVADVDELIGKLKALGVVA